MAQPPTQAAEAPPTRVTVVAKSNGGWAPTGGMVDPAGNLWILEGGVPKGTRLRRIHQGGGQTIY